MANPTVDGAKGCLGRCCGSQRFEVGETWEILRPPIKWSITGGYENPYLIGGIQGPKSHIIHISRVK